MSPPRWPIALRTSICMGAPVALGLASGDLTSGLFATIGAFTALYAPERPYRNRAVVLACVALALTAGVAVGLLSQPAHWAAIPLVALIAAVATFVCNAGGIGPPGAYMIALACAVGTALPAAAPPWRIALLVLGGGALSCLVSLSGALVDPRGPERAAVLAAAAAVERFGAAEDPQARERARREAAFRLHRGWAALVTFQPPVRREGRLARLRGLLWRLHRLFAQANLAEPARQDRRELARGAARIGRIARSVRRRGAGADPGQLPLGPFGMMEALRDDLRPSSPVLIAAARVGLGCALAGVLAAALGAGRIYWAMAAAMVVLHQGLDWARTLGRGFERIVGTLLGLALAAGVLAVRPSGAWLVLTMMALQFAAEMLVVRRYAAAVVFVTAIALVVATGGGAAPHVGPLLRARGEDTAIGCVVGLLVHLLTAPRRPAAHILLELRRTLAAIQALLERVRMGEVTSEGARRVRRELQHRLLALHGAWQAAQGGLPASRRQAEETSVLCLAGERLGYGVLAACWRLEAAQRAGSGSGDGLAPEVLAEHQAELEDLRVRLARDLAAG